MSPKQYSPFTSVIVVPVIIAVVVIVAVVPIGLVVVSVMVEEPREVIRATVIGKPVDSSVTVPWREQAEV
jgi:hypothetical protein